MRTVIFQLYDNEYNPQGLYITPPVTEKQFGILQGNLEEDQEAKRILYDNEDADELSLYLQANYGITRIFIDEISI